MNKNWMIADLHIHSRFSRACSKSITIPELVKWAKIKGLNLLGTGDFTHPIWIQEIRDLLVEKKGFYYYEDFPFVLSGEISLIYTQERGRKVHLVLLVPSIEVVDKINFYLDKKGRRDYDGRPIFKISCEQFVKDMKEIPEELRDKELEQKTSKDGLEEGSLAWIWILFGLAVIVIVAVVISLRKKWR